MSLLSDLKLVLPAEEYTAVENLPETLLTTIHASKVKEIEAKKREAQLLEDKKNAWANSVEVVEPEDDIPTKELVHLLGQLKFGEKPVALKRAKAGTGLWAKAEVCEYLLKLVKADKERAEAEYEKSVMAKPKGRRASFSGKKIVQNPDEPQGADGKYYFVGDEDATFDKPQKPKVDGSKTWIRKAIKSDRYLGGAESDPDDGICQGAISWDRAQGSVAIKKAGMSATLFKQRCGATAGEGGLCAKCQKFKSPNFFTGTYQIGGKYAKFGGITYKDFIAENLVYA
jgi:hypothetical protein